MTTGSAPRRRGLAGLLVGSACVAAAVGMAVPAGAGPLVKPEPTDPTGYLVAERDAKFLSALDRVGIAHPGDPEAVGTAKHACARILDGTTVRDAVAEVAAANPGLSVLKASHFVAVARVIYCPGAAEVVIHE